MAGPEQKKPFEMEGRNNGTFIYKWRIFQHAENCLRSIWGDANPSPKYLRLQFLIVLAGMEIGKY